MGLNLHPSLGKASAKAAEEHGMAKRGSTLICGYKNYHRRLETCLGELKKKEIDMYRPCINTSILAISTNCTLYTKWNLIRVFNLKSIICLFYR
ncbi:8-amino-7-oxononanoate synthase-like isoform X1 [Daucus carota subsp. sativus]|uniref:8-amino-7-oxononanoate synthase-like isoform X1 n=1 Tax=Daucus carota subsp. sativus TaxID=79200 RepID=UPI003083CFCE